MATLEMIPDRQLVLDRQRQDDFVERLQHMHMVVRIQMRWFDARLANFFDLRMPLRIDLIQIQ